MPQAFTVDIRKLTYGELWRLAPGLPFLVAAFFKASNIPLKMGANVACVDALATLSESEIPGDVAGRMDPLLWEWTRLGFQLAFYYTLPPAAEGQRAFAAALLSADALTVGQVLFAETSASGTVVRELVANCFSVMTDGTFFGVSSERKRMNPPPEVRGVNLPGKPPGVLYDRHRRELARMERSFPVPQSPAGLGALLLRMNNRHVEFQASRGVYTPTGG